MKKNVKILGAAAAALLAVAPVVASATTVNADFHIQPGTTTTSNSNVPLSLDISMNATGGLTTAADAASSVKISSGIGTVNRTKDSVVSIIDDQGSTVTGTLQPGTAYRVQITNVSINGLTNNVTYDLGQATFQEGATPADSQTTKPDAGATPDANQTAGTGAPAANQTGSHTLTGSQLVGPGTLTSAPFYLVKTGDTTQPYFYNLKGDAAGNQLSNGQVAYVGENGEGVVVGENSVAGEDSEGHVNVIDRSAQGILAAAVDSVGVKNGDITTTADDIRSQLAEQNVALSDGKYVLPVNGFHVTLTAVNHMSGKTVTVVVPFAGSEADYSHFPFVTFDSSEVSKDGYSDTFKGVWAQGTQSKDASQLIRVIPLGSTFYSSDAVKGFKANVSGTKPNNSAEAAGTGSTIDMAVLSNPVNTQVPGQYTVTLQATNWANGKTTRFQYIVQVGENGATYQTVNYPAAYGVNVWNIAGNTASFTGRRVQGGSRVATFGTKTVNGVSYTRIGSENSNNWIQTQYLGNHSNENKPSNNGETKLNGTGRVSYNGKGSVRLLNANGHYVDQYVKKGSSFKVWAEKTVNGQHLYRIGSQSQWIPAKYFSLN